MFSWIKRNKLASLLLLIIFLWFVRQVTGSFLGFDTLGRAELPSIDASRGLGGISQGPTSLGVPVMEKMMRDTSYFPAPEAPPTDMKDRLVIQNSELSLLVANVTETRNKIVAHAEANGGYMVNSNVSNPQDAPTAVVTIRIDSTKLQAALEYFHSLGVKVVSENLSGYDVTDEYVDVEKRIAILEQTKAKFAEILAAAREVSDITNLNQQIISIQSQIDSYKGQQEALKQNAKLARLTVYLSTDEIALPYAPSETFRPQVVFKLAVRSLVSKVRQIATVAIWIGVYGVIWVPLLIVGRYVYRRFKTKV